MQWHIINHHDYIDGPFDSYEAALREACALGKETRSEPELRRRADRFLCLQGSLRSQGALAAGILDLHQGSGHCRRRMPRTSSRSRCSRPGDSEAPVLE